MENKQTPERDKEVVLLVEDEFFIREDTANILTNDGFEVVQASAAEEALDLLSERPEVSVLFTDVNLPGMSGLQLVKEVLARWPHIRVLVTSGRATPTTDDIPSRFISKPYMPEAMVATVRDLLDDNRRAIRHMPAKPTSNHWRLER